MNKLKHKHTYNHMFFKETESHLYDMNDHFGHLWMISVLEIRI